MGKKDDYKSTPAYRKYGALIFKDCFDRLQNKALAEEAEQEVFARLTAKGPNFKPPTTLIAWLRKTAELVCKEIKRNQRTQRKYEKLVAHLLSECYAPDHTAEDREAVAKILATLSEKERQLLRLRAADEKTWEEVGKDVGMKPDAARMRYERLCEDLRRRFPDLAP